MEREWPEQGCRGGGKGGWLGCCAAAMPITMSATCHLNNIKLIAENLPPSSSIEWLRNMGVVWPIFQGGAAAGSNWLSLYVFNYLSLFTRSPYPRPKRGLACSLRPWLQCSPARWPIPIPMLCLVRQFVVCACRGHC